MYLNKQLRNQIWYFLPLWSSRPMRAKPRYSSTNESGPVQREGGSEGEGSGSSLTSVVSPHLSPNPDQAVTVRVAWLSWWCLFTILLSNTSDLQTSGLWTVGDSFDNLISVSKLWFSVFLLMIFVNDHNLKWLICNRFHPISCCKFQFLFLFISWQ